MTPGLGELVTDRPLAFFDLETTGKDVKNARVVEIGLEIYFPPGQGETYRRVRRVNPGVAIPADATEVHGITDADVADEPTFSQIARNLLAFLEQCDLAGFGVRRYDLPVLVHEFKRAGIRFDPRRLTSGEDRKIIDLLMLFHLEEPRDLAAAVRRYAERELEDAHSAAADTAVLPHVLLGMIAKHPATLSADLAALHARCDEYAPYESEVERWFGPDLENPVFQFGAHRDRPLLQAEEGYIAWMLRNADIDEDVKEFVREFLRRAVVNT